MKRILGTIVVLAMLTGCSDSRVALSPYFKEPLIAEYTVSGEVLKSLPPAKVKIPVSVYNFSDQTGQNKPNDTIAEFSHAVTQGGVSILTQALLDASQGGWFTVIERNGLENLIQERKIIRAMRNDYAAPNGQKLPNIPPLLYAGMLIEGGITSYETNTISGGVGARYLGIGADSEYRRDIVTVYLRAVKVSNGEIVLSTSTSKTIYSTNVQGGTFKYIGLNELLEIETGFTMNEPPQLATRQAIELAVYSMIMEGAERNLWGFANPSAGRVAVGQYERLKEARRMSFESALKAAELRSLPQNRDEAIKRTAEEDDASLTSQIFTLFKKKEQQASKKTQSQSSAQPMPRAPVQISPSAMQTTTPVPAQAPVVGVVSAGNTFVPQQTTRPLVQPFTEQSPAATEGSAPRPTFQRYVSPQAETSTPSQGFEGSEGVINAQPRTNGFRIPIPDEYKEKKYLNCGGQGC